MTKRKPSEHPTLFSQAPDSEEGVTDERKLGWGVIVEFEWHIPWPADWDLEKKVRASQKLVEYMTQGTIIETSTRMRVTKADVIEPFKVADTDAKVRRDPFIRYRLEH